MYCTFTPNGALFNNSGDGEAVPQVLYSLLTANFQEVILCLDKNFTESNEAIQKNLTEIISLRFPRVEVYIYGSRELGMGTQQSDLDVYVDIDQSYHILGRDKPVMETLEAVFGILKDNPDVWENINVIDGNVPTIKAFNKIENINCDISFSDGLAHSTTQLFKNLYDVQPIFRDMSIILGHWLDVIELSRYINKYTLQLLILNYLQTELLLPSIMRVQKSIPNPVKIGAWNVDFNEKKMSRWLKWKSKTWGDLEEHVKGFFAKYNNTKAFRHILTTYLGTGIPLKELYKPKFKNYHKFIRTYGESERYRFSDMNVQGPFDLATNPAIGVSKQHLKRLVYFSKLSHNFMTNVGLFYVY